MNQRLFVRIFCFVIVAFAAFTVSGSAQKPGSTVPRQERLLNGMKVLIWNQPAAGQVTVKLRIHSGSAFDPQGREGVMKLLAESIFPNEAAREFFKDDLGGGLEIVSNYDYIQINASSRTDEYLTMLETIAQAVSNPTIDKETTAALKTELTARLKARETDPAYAADLAVARRLFGNFPYGRPQLGTTESLAKIDFADLLFAKERLFSADNATLTIIGNVNGDTAFRAARRYFGAWLKSDKKIPSTFRQPDVPDTSLQIINAVDESGSSEARHAIRGFARADRDYYASEILTSILDQRLKALIKSDSRVSAFVRNEAHALPGAIVFGLSNPSTETKASIYQGKPIIDANSLVSKLLAASISSDEFQMAKTAVLSAKNVEPLDEHYLDIDTFKLNTAENEGKIIDALTPADIQSLTVKLRGLPSANVWLFKSVETK